MESKPEFLVIGQYLEGINGIYPSLFDRRHYKVLGVYRPADGTAPEDYVQNVLDQFMDEYMQTSEDAQRFFPEVQVVQIGNSWDVNIEQQAKQRLGEVIRLPNPRRYSEVSYYFLRGDQA